LRIVSDGQLTKRLYVRLSCRTYSRFVSYFFVSSVKAKENVFVRPRMGVVEVEG
jgi:hypothetical protein